MKNKFKILGIIALVAVMGFSFAGCQTASSIGGTADTHGLLSQANAAAQGGVEIASYSVIFGLFDAGYTAYANAVKSAEDAGKKISTVTTWYFGIVTVTKAYAR